MFARTVQSIKSINRSKAYFRTGIVSGCLGSYFSYYDSKYGKHPSTLASEKFTGGILSFLGGVVTGPLFSSVALAAAYSAYKKHQSIPYYLHNICDGCDVEEYW